MIKFFIELDVIAQVLIVVFGSGLGALAIMGYLDVRANEKDQAVAKLKKDEELCGKMS